MNYHSVWKRPLDLVLASLMFLILFPVFLLLVISLSIHFRSSPFFLQTRPGLHGRAFKIVKFKTMRNAWDSKGELLSDGERITGFGKLIRKSSLDEIPQLINVLKGEMSLVGPRPLLLEYLPLYSKVHSRRHHVKPGVTGWAQINGRNAISWEQKFNYDVWYVDNVSFLLDVNILSQTLVNVIKGKGISQHGHVTVGKYKG